MQSRILLSLFALCALKSQVAVLAWDNEDFEIFDLVEEINENFYKLLNVEQVMMNVDQCDE